MSHFLVCRERCDQCLFSPGRIVSKARMRELVRECDRNDTHFICHKATIAGKDVACRGWYETRSSNFSRIADRLGVVRFVDVGNRGEAA